jgi:hypothetical protein
LKVEENDDPGKPAISDPPALAVAQKAQGAAASVPAGRLH